jgi:hypothetical protein
MVLQHAVHRAAAATFSRALLVGLKAGSELHRRTWRRRGQRELRAGARGKDNEGEHCGRQQDAPV